MPHWSQEPSSLGPILVLAISCDSFGKISCKNGHNSAMAEQKQHFLVLEIELIRMIKATSKYFLINLSSLYS